MIWWRYHGLAVAGLIILMVGVFIGGAWLPLWSGLGFGVVSRAVSLAYFQGKADGAAHMWVAMTDKK